MSVLKNPLADFEEALQELARVGGLTEQTRAIRLGILARSAGVNPPLMSVLARVVARGNMNSFDVRDVREAFSWRPWHDADPGDVWVVRFDNYSPAAMRVVEVEGVLCFVSDDLGSVEVDSGRVKDAHRIWPEVGGQ